MRSFRRYLSEKEIIVGKGARYGQIIFLAGGAGSGKGFAIKHFLQGNKFKIRDVDEWKQAFLKLAVMKQKYAKLRKLDLRNPKDVFKLHKFVKEKGIKDKTLNLMLTQAKSGRLPNIIFDITLKDKDDITEVLPSLVSVGYNPRDVHVVWVLTDYMVAVKQNKSRPRVVPDDIMLKTHMGARDTMWQMINKGTPATIDGSVHIVLGGAKHTVFWKDKDGNELDGSLKSKYGTDRVVVKDFKYVTVKEPGKNMEDDISLRMEILNWIKDKTPRSHRMKGMFGSEEGEYTGKDRPKLVNPLTGDLEEELQEGKAPLPQIYCDMDEVLVAFLDGTTSVLGKSYADKSWKGSGVDKKALLNKKAPNLFRNLKWKKDGKKLWNYIKGHAPKILSAYPQKWMPNAKSDKAQWVKKNLGIPSGNVHLVARADKQKFAVNQKGQPNILIDDHTKNIREWRDKGGVGIVHRSASDTISKLKKMGF